MLKILQARLQQYVNRELPDVQAGFRKGRGTRDQIANIRLIIEKASEFQKNSTASLTTLKPLTVWITTNCGKFLKDGNTGPPDLLPEKPVSGQEATVRTVHGTTDWFQIGKGVCQAYILSPCLCREHHAKYWAERNTCWNQDFLEKY